VLLDERFRRRYERVRRRMERGQLPLVPWADEVDGLAYAALAYELDV
jgi:hypothetical protein